MLNFDEFALFYIEISILTEMSTPYQQIFSQLAVFRDSLASPTKLQWSSQESCHKLDEILAFLCENRVSLRISPKGRETCMLCFEKIDRSLADSFASLTDCDCLQAAHRNCLRTEAFSQRHSLQNSERRPHCTCCGKPVSLQVFAAVFEEKVFAEILKEPAAATAKIKSPQQQTQVKTAIVEESKKKPASFECSVCLQSLLVEKDCITLDCEHRYCSSCLEGYIKEQINSNKVKSEEICCFTCKRPISIFQIQYVLKFKDFKEFQRKSIVFDTSFIRNDEVLVKCPKANCDNQVIISNKFDITHHKCELCGLLFCVRGCEKPHPSLTCEENRRKKQENEHDNMFENIIRNEQWQKCPKCGAVVAKNQGCNHMTCRCGAEFCYICRSQPGTNCHKGENIFRRVFGI